MSAGSLRILMVSPVPTDPPDAGNRVRIMTLAQGLIQAGHEVHFAYIPLEPYDLVAMQSRYGSTRVHVLNAVPPRPGPLARMARKLGRFLNIERAFMWRLDDWYSAAANAELAALHAQHRYDVVFAEYVFASKALEALPPDCLRVLDTHDCFGLRHRAYLKAGMRPQWFSTSLEEEERGFRRADIVLAIQASEARDFATRVAGSSTRVLQVGHLIDMPVSSNPSARQAAVFVGSGNPINTTGARHFIDNVLPIVRRAKPGFELLLAGAVSNEIEAQPGIVRLGFVPQLADAFDAAMIAINPVRAGTGINIKLLDAMAAGMPIVTTRSGARGLDAYFERAFCVADDDDAQSFADSILRLLDDAALRRQFAEAARAAAQEWNSEQVAALATALASHVPQAAKGEKKILMPSI
ncbi:glycosyltransferase family 4 protein [Pseudorhodoferax sp. Leaf274]|uniref:glycosyltransferase family 4 protein n=1 Tax=Pseudorhodoferax sp. Leaf274 TaxID=1736318 RepID=UPI000702DF23|nr:glycosyltransferase family 4 protein [Pseudorhodoferax sp. Leaf274]KQP43201.1 hypothetical protein ASF44_06435 [Pseudorhodoferax sp. Leaf274]